MADTGNTERNRAHFDEHASTYTSKFQKTIDQLVTEVRNRKEWIGVNWVEEEDSGADDPSNSSSSAPKRTVRLLDYACGPGTISRALAPYITSTLGIDLSTSMVAEFNKAASNQGLSKQEMHAVVGNLVAETPDPAFDGPEYWDFDIAVVGLGFHHFDDPGLAAKRLVQRLKKGGVLMIIDFLPHGPGQSHNHSHSHGHNHNGHSHGKAKENDGPGSAVHTVSHHGFSLEDVKVMFEEAGAGEGFEVVNLGGAVVFASGPRDKDGDGEGKGEGKDFRRVVFMARGVKL